MSSSPHEDTWFHFPSNNIRKYLFQKKHRLPHPWCKKVYFLLYSFRSISNEIGWFINKKLLISDDVQKIPSIFIFWKTLLRDESDMTNDDVRVNQGFRKIRLLHFRIKAAWIWDLVEIFQRGSFLIQTVKATTYKPHDLIMKSFQAYYILQLNSTITISTTYLVFQIKTNIEWLSWVNKAPPTIQHQSLFMFLP